MLEELREKANRLPALPGVYIMRDKAGEVIYVGKAKRLKNRVTSYFRGDHEPKTRAMVSKVADFDVIVAAGEFEALVLENSLIKRHKPHYNILLRDDKGYPFIRLDEKSEYPRFTVVNRPAEDGARYFGPYGGRSVSFGIIDTVSKALRLPTCGKTFPRDRGKERPCLNYQMGSCAGYCRPEMPSESYRGAIDQAVMIFEGKTAQLIGALTEQMTAAAEDLNFELAATLRDRIKAIEGLENRQMVVSLFKTDTDAVGFHRGPRCCFTVLHYVEGALADKEAQLVSEPLEDDCAACSAMVRQYYMNRGVWPKTILLPCLPEDAEELSRLFSEAAGRKVAVEWPQRGDKVRLVEAAALNAREEVMRATTAQQRRLKTLAWLKETLGLEELPQRIEAFDVSNFGDVGIVAAMTVFKDGKPYKKDYRKFKIEGTGGRDDYAAMAQAVSRRFLRYEKGDEKFGELPDLLLIDGGAAHASAARKAIEELGLSLPVFGMVKDDRHKTRALVSVTGDEIGISGNPAAFALVGSIQEETHRSAISYQIKLRSGEIGSQLDNIKGVGEKRRAELLKHFKSVKAVREASLEALCKIVPKNTANAVYAYFHSEGDKEI